MKVDLSSGDKNLLLKKASARVRFCSSGALNFGLLMDNKEE